MNRIKTSLLCAGVAGALLMGCATKSGVAIRATKEEPFVNSLGMKFVPVPGTKVLFSIWETRVKDYAAYAGANASVDVTWQEGVFGENPLTPQEDCPVILVSWDDANAFCAWLTKSERAEGRLSDKNEYRLPTDIEWSVAVGLKEEKGSTPGEKASLNKDVFPWGTAWPPPEGAGNYADATLSEKMGRRRVIEGYRDGFAGTAPVGSFPANQFGLFDLGGNVWEWVEDEYTPGEKQRTIRGGAWSSPQRSNLQSSLRGMGPTTSRTSITGFRCVLAPVAAGK